MEETVKTMAEQRFEKAKRFRSNRKDFMWKQLDAFDRGEHWALTKKPAWFPKPVTNLINFVKKYKVASVAVDNLTPTIRPLSKDDVEACEQLQGIFKDIWYYTGAKFAVRRVVERAKLLGTGAIYVTYNPNKIRGGRNMNNKGEIIIENIDPSNIYPDPNAFTLEDCDYLFISERKTINWITSNPSFRDEDGKFIGDLVKIKQGTTKPNEFPVVTTTEERGEIYNRDYTDSQMDNLVHFVHYMYKSIDKEGVEHLKLQYYANWNKIGEEIELPYRNYPLVFLYDQEQTDDIWGISDCQQILDNQKTLNITESVIALYATMLQSPQKIVSKNSGISAKRVASYGSAPGMVWETNSDINSSIKNLDTPKLDSVVINYKNNLEEGINKVTGLTSAYMGSNVGSLTTTGGVNTLVNRALVLDKDFNIQLEEFLKKLSNLIIDVFQSYVDKNSSYYFRDNVEDPNINAKFGFIELKPEDMQVIVDLDYDVIFDTSSFNVDEVQKAKEDAQNLMQMQLQFQSNPALITIPEFIAMSNFSNKEQIISRFMKESKEMQTERMQQFVMTIMQTLTDPQAMQDPQVLQTSLQDLVSMGVKMTNPYAQEEQKLGSVQQRQSAPAQPLKATGTSTS